MDIAPILSTLRRHKTAASLIVMEVALTCAIVCNAVFLIGDRVQRMDAPTGMAEHEMVMLSVANTTPRGNVDALTQQDLAALRQVPGVKAATISNQVPFGENDSSTSVNLTPDQQTPNMSASFYMVGPQAIETMGLRVVAGRAFTPDEFRPLSVVDVETSPRVPAAMLDSSTAARLFPGKPAVGQVIYVLGDQPTRVVGVFEQLAPAGDRAHGSDPDAIMIPVWPQYRSGYYVLRVASPADRERVMREAATVLENLDHRRVVRQKATLDELRHKYYGQDRWMTLVLVAVCVALLVITAFGIVGLASFWVQQRTRMIGVRRALGASRRQVRQYFQLENALLTTLGIVLGMVGAFGLNQVLMKHYELDRLPWTVLPVGAVALWALGQLAVMGPARRAAALPPVQVMRGV